jgi:hypothetical protein
MPGKIPGFCRSIANQPGPGGCNRHSWSAAGNRGTGSIRTYEVPESRIAGGRLWLKGKLADWLKQDKFTCRLCPKT